MSRIQHILEKAEREGTVRRVRDFGDTLSMPAVATMADPVSRAPAAAADSLAAAVPAAVLPRLITGARLDPRLIAATSTNTVAAEQYRALRTRILHSENGSATNVVLVTSPGRGEGRTLTAANLALTMAQDFQRRICLIDADLRHPRIHQMFGITDSPGLSDVLAGQALLEDALITLEEQQITILPAGVLPARPAELLGSTAMRRVIDSLRSQFDRVIIDSPPATPLADVGIVTPLVDSVLLVVRAGITAKPAVHDAVTAIEEGKLLGIVLNEAAA